jgi:hypothetical protein
MTDLLVTVGDLTITDRFYATRSMTESLASPLSAEDQTVQSIPYFSPVWWHQEHTSWFFDTCLLFQFDPDYHPFDPLFGSTTRRGRRPVSLPRLRIVVAFGINEIMSTGPT